MQDRPPVLQHRPEGIESAVVACEMRGLVCRKARQGTVRSGKECGEQEKECKTSVEWRACGLMNMLSRVRAALGLDRGLCSWFEAGE